MIGILLIFILKILGIEDNIKKKRFIGAFIGAVFHLHIDGVVLQE